MFVVDTEAKPQWLELIPARGDKPPVEVLFPPLPTPLALRRARVACREIMAKGGAFALDMGGDAFSRELIRHSILAWRGIVDQNQVAIAPTHDVVIPGDDGEEPTIERGTISAFLAEPRLFEAADRVFVIPFVERDAEKNGFAPSPNGTSAGATKASDTASSPAGSTKTAGAGTKKRGKRPAPTKSTSRARKPARVSGRS